MARELRLIAYFIWKLGDKTHPLDKQIYFWT